MERVVIIEGDSIIIHHQENSADSMCCSGDSFAKLYAHFDKGYKHLLSFDYNIVHEGTNNINRRDSNRDIIADYENLFQSLKCKK